MLEQDWITEGQRGEISPVYDRERQSMIFSALANGS